MLTYSLSPADLGFEREPVIENVLLSECVPEDDDRELMLAEQRELESFWYDQKKPIVRRRPICESEVEDQAPLSTWSSLVAAPEACSVVRSSLACIDLQRNEPNNKARTTKPQVQGLVFHPTPAAETPGPESKRDWLTGGDFLINKPRAVNASSNNTNTTKKSTPRPASKKKPSGSRSPQAKPKQQNPHHRSKKNHDKKKRASAKKAGSPVSDPQDRLVFAGVTLGKRPSADAVEGSRKERLVRFVTNAVGPGRVSGILRRLRELGVVEVGDLTWLERRDFAVPHVSESDARALFNAIAFMSTATCLSVTSTGAAKVHPSSGSSWSLSSAGTATHTHDSGAPRVWSGEYPVSIGAAHNKHPFSYLRSRASH